MFIEKQIPRRGIATAAAVNHIGIERHEG